MTFEEARKAIYCTVPYVFLNRFPPAGKVYVSLYGDFDVDELREIVKTIEAIDDK